METTHDLSVSYGENIIHLDYDEPQVADLARGPVRQEGVLSDAPEVICCTQYSTPSTTQHAWRSSASLESPHNFGLSLKPYSALSTNQTSSGSHKPMSMVILGGITATGSPFQGASTNACRVSVVPATHGFSAAYARMARSVVASAPAPYKSTISSAGRYNYRKLQTLSFVGNPCRLALQ